MKVPIRRVEAVHLELDVGTCGRVERLCSRSM
jgi:hypothetical protein